MKRLVGFALLATMTLRIDSYPQFPTLVKAYADARGVPKTDSASTLSVDIALALARELKAELESQE